MIMKIKDMKRIAVWICALGVLGLAGCKAPAAVTGPEKIDFKTDGASQTISITSNRDWTVTSSEAWCTVSPKSGAASDGPITISVRCEPNSGYDVRNATLTVRAEEVFHRIAVSQEQNYGLFLDGDLFRADFQAQDLVVSAETNVEMTVTVVSGSDWLRSASSTKGLVKKDVTLHMDENRSGAVREAEVKLSGGSLSSTVVVKQAPYHKILDTEIPGAYRLREADYLYRPGVTQLSRGKSGGSSFFRVLDPENLVVLTASGIQEDTPLAEAFPLNVSLVGEEGELFRKDYRATVLKESADLLWLLLDDNTGIIVKK